MSATRFLPAAEAEFLKEIEYYSGIREGLGIRFQLSVMVAIGKAVANPGGGAPSYKGTRGRLVKDFPFRIVYRVAEGELLIVAVSHQRRRPAYWLQRID
ncbi:MAG TPA: type II toxin-antitoxin system RelE/ParE family toxin [Burkholderiales bacterium]|nr:type II toxin-antitoxin system RelE/ParE family toxin [Burkholderiales bacterium]